MAAMLSGCATSHFYRHPQYSKQRLMKDWSECQSMNPYIGRDRIGMDQFQDQCMQGRGWISGEA
jgi:hypothetical protein